MTTVLNDSPRPFVNEFGDAHVVGWRFIES